MQQPSPFQDWPGGEQISLVLSGGTSFEVPSETSVPHMHSSDFYFGSTEGISGVSEG